MTNNFIILAYLDPGTGSILLQVVLASLLAIAVGFRIFWRKIKGIFRKDTALEDPEAENDDE